MKLDDWQRIEKTVRWAGLSVNSFALNIGLQRGENLYQIKRGNNGISKELAELIVKKYPEISRGWILTGEGRMFLSDTGEKVNIQCYDADVLCIASAENLPEPSYLISLPRVRNADFAALNMNKAMEPEIPNGATVIVKQTEPDAIIPGYPYVVITNKISVLRTIKKGPAEDKIRLTAANPDFDEMIIDVCEIRKLYAVKGHIYFNQ